MIVAITGGSGFTGRFVVERLLAAGHTLRCLARPSSDLACAPGRVERIEGSLEDVGSLRRLLRGAEALVAVSSLGFGHAPNLVEACESEKPQRAVFFSTTAIFTHLDAATRPARLEAERLIEKSRVGWTILRPTMIYGTEGDRNMSRLIRFLARSPVVPLPGGGRALIQPVHAEDLAIAVLGVLAHPATERRAFNVPGADAAALCDVVRYLLRKIRRRALILPLPIGLMAAAAGLWGSTRLPPRIRAEQILRLAEDKAFALDEAREAFGYRPRTWHEGLSAEVVRLKEIGWIR